MPLPSEQSYREFLRLAFAYLTNPGPVRPNAGLAVNRLYRLYCYYDSNPLVPPKVPLADAQLCQAMIDLITNANTGGINRFIRIQDDNFSVMNQATVLGQYQNWQQNNIALTDRQAIIALTSYLHVYPTATQWPDHNTNQLTRPRGLPRNNDWRIGINVKPRRIATVAQNLLPLMDYREDVDHIKFAAPGMAGKPDSVIIFLRRRRRTYLQFRGFVQNAVNPQHILAKFLPMWNEFAAGLGDAAEPPRRDFSFGTYRCILAYLAFPVHGTEAAALSFPQYLDSVDDMFERFGIPRYIPHEQGRLYIPPVDAALQRRLMAAKALYDGKSFDAYQDSRLDVYNSQL